MALQFPLNPVVGQVYTDPTGNVSFQWNGVQWVSTKALPVASDAEMLAGTADFIFATPKKLKLGFAMLLAANGYFKFPTWLGGLIIQWGHEEGGMHDTAKIVDLPMEFPTACLNLSVTPNVDGGIGGVSVVSAHGHIVSNSQIKLGITDVNDSAVDVYWFAIGH